MIPPVVVVHLADRAQRLAYDRALRAAGMSVRLASRPAELAKALADGVPRVVVSDTGLPDGIESGVGGVDGAVPTVIRVSSSTVPEELLPRIVAALSPRP